MAFRVEIRVQPPLRPVEKLFGGKTVKTKQPVGLIEPMLAPERRRRADRGEGMYVVHGNISGIKDALQAVACIEGGGQRQDMTVAFICRADDHLRALSCGSEARRMTKPDEVAAVFVDAAANQRHGA